MNCYPTGLPEITLQYKKRKNLLNSFEYCVVGVNRAEKWLSQKQFNKHFKHYESN